MFLGLFLLFLWIIDENLFVLNIILAPISILKDRVITVLDLLELDLFLIENLREVISISKLYVHLFFRSPLLGDIAVRFKTIPAFDRQLIFLSNSTNKSFGSALFHLGLRNLWQCIDLSIFTQRCGFFGLGFALILLLLFLVIIVDGSFQVPISPLQKFADLPVLQSSVLDNGPKERNGLVHRFILNSDSGYFTARQQNKSPYRAVHFQSHPQPSLY